MYLQLPIWFAIIVSFLVKRLVFIIILMFLHFEQQFWINLNQIYCGTDVFYKNNTFLLKFIWNKNKNIEIVMSNFKHFLFKVQMIFHVFNYWRSNLNCTFSIHISCKYSKVRLATNGFECVKEPNYWQSN